MTASLPSLEDVLKIASEPLHFARKQQIYYPHSAGVYYVLSGVVRVFRTTDQGENSHVDFYRSEHFFGLSCLEPRERGERPHETAVAHTDCVLYAWPTAHIETLLDCRPALRTALMVEALAQSARFYERLTRIQHSKISSMLRWTLLDLATRIGTPGAPGEARIQPGITHQVLAAMVGTSREIVTFYLNEFRRSGAIDFTRQVLVIRPGVLREVGGNGRKAAAA